MRSYAQEKFDTALISRNQVRNTPFVNLEIADSFSTKGDSINASASFLKVDPYYLMMQGITPEDLDKEFAKHSITINAQKTYRERFTKTFSTPRTEIYKQLAKMFEEDQATRDKVAKCKDSFSYVVYENRMAHSDSIHFVWLYNYVQKSGWPPP